MDGLDVFFATVLAWLVWKVVQHEKAISLLARGMQKAADFLMNQKRPWPPEE